MNKYVGLKTGKLHESHVISEYYCGGCGHPLTDHDSFCPECGGALRECDADTLEEENAKLRELVRDIWGDGMTLGMARKLKAENARLRELVMAFWWCTENFDMTCKCDRCPLWQSDKLTPECEVRMRELGMGVE